MGQRRRPSSSAVVATAWALAAALAAAAGSGCFSLKGEAAAPDQAYILVGTEEGDEPARPKPVSRPEGCLVLRVAEPDAAPGLETTRMAYSREPYRVEYYAENRWVDTPSAMLAPLLVRTLTRSGLFRAVVPQATPVTRADLLLQTELLRLQQVFSDERSEAQVALAVTLLSADGRRVLARRTFQAHEPAPHDDPYGGVIAANRAVGRILGELETFLREQLGAADGVACDHR